MKVKIDSLAAVSALLLASGCMTTRERIARYGNAVSYGRYQEAERIVSDGARPGTKDGLCWQLHKGSALAWQGRLDESTRAFDEAEDAYWNLDESSAVTRGAEHGAAVLLNDTVYPYAGTGHERIFCCLYKALNYAALGQYDAARDEFNRAGERQNRYFEERRKALQREEQAIQRELGGHRNANGWSQTILANGALNSAVSERCSYAHNLAQDPTALLGMLASRDFYNAYAGHVRAVFRALNGDSARDDFKHVASIRSDVALVSRDAVDFESGRLPEGYVWVYVEDGLCPVREETRIDLPLGLIPYQEHILYTGMALPYLVYRPEASDHYAIASSKENREMELLTDVDQLVKTEFDIAFHGVVAREVTRLILRTLPQIALEEAARHDRDNAGLYRLGQVLSAGFNLATIAADLRIWSGLPKRVFAQRVAFAPGDTLTLGTRNGDIAIPLPEGCVNAIAIVKYPAPMAAPVITVIPFNPKQGVNP